MKISSSVPKICLTVLMLVSINLAMASTTPSTTQTSVAKNPKPMSTEDSTEKTPKMQLTMKLTRSTSLIDFQDGSRNDTLNYEVSPSLLTSFGTFKTIITYNQNLRDEYSTTTNDWGDLPIAYIFKPTIWKWNTNDVRITYSLSSVIPLSQNSVKRDQLQTSFSGKIGISVRPIENGFTYGFNISAGRNIHAYEEDINGSVLNKYSSNQNASFGYNLGDWSINLDFINRSRWTYQNNPKSAFAITEELSFNANESFSITIGHTNSGSTLKPNGTDSNIDIYNENSSNVYASLGLSY